MTLNDTDEESRRAVTPAVLLFILLLFTYMKNGAKVYMIYETFRMEKKVIQF